MLEKLDHVPKPTGPGFPTPERLSVDFMSISSVLIPVALLIAGEPADIGIPLLLLEGLAGRAVWSRFSIRERCSKMSLSPASSLMPGSL